MQLIQNFPDGSLLLFDDGAFDPWCVYLQRPQQPRYAPKDIEYFSRLNELAAVYGNQKVYRDFVAIYARTAQNIDPSVLKMIHELAAGYAQHRLDAEILFTILYAGMVAEENRNNALLKKRIKRLGIHQLLLEDFTPQQAATFSRGKKWNELDRMCKARGF